MLVATVVCAVVAALGAWFVPRLVAVVPEPEPHEDDATPVAEKELYADIARTPHLAARSALVGAVVGGVIGAAVGLSWPLLYLLPAVPLGVALSVIDWRTRRLPTWYLAPAYPVLVVLVVVCAVVTRDWDDLLRAGLGWVVMGGFYLVTWLVSPRTMGMGDVRLAGLLGIGLGYLGWAPLLVGMYVAFLVFGIPPLVLAVVRLDRSLLKSRIPFGPAMLAGAVLGVVVGQPLVDWYARTNGLA